MVPILKVLKGYIKGKVYMYKMVTRFYNRKTLTELVNKLV